MTGGAIATSTEQQTQFFAEYGLRDTTTLGLTVFGKYPEPSEQSELRIGIHVRQRVWQGEAGDVASLQLRGEFPAERWLGDLGGPRPFSVTEITATGLYGRGWQSDWGNSFVAVEAGGQVRAEGLDDEIELAFDIGHRPMRSLLGLVQTRAEIPISDPSTATIKVRPSVAWTFWPWIGANEKKPRTLRTPPTLQIGAEIDIANPDDGVLLGVSLWKSF